MNCPCGSQLLFTDCCQRFHNNHEAISTAEQLMRARYSAFVVANIDFLYNTFHPDTKRFQSKKDIQQWAMESKWMQLQIVKSSKDTVEFKAHYMDTAFQTQIHHERSNFRYHQNKWYYYDGILL